MKGQRRRLTEAVGILVILLLASGVHGKIPEPDNIIYGLAGDGAVSVKLKVNDQQIASYTMGTNPNAAGYYILRIPMDSLEPAVTGSAHLGDVATIFINGEIEPAASVTLGERGAVFRLDLGIIDTDGDGLPDDWEQQIIHADPNDAFANIADVLPGDDFDGDGETNALEHLNGTDPTDAMSTHDPANAYANFHFEIYRGVIQTNTIEFIPSFWGAQLICGVEEGETIIDATLTKPTAIGGNETFLLAVSSQGDEAEFSNDAYASVDDLMTDFVPGDYWVKLEIDGAGGGAYHLRFKLNVPAYNQASFPDYIAVEAPSPDENGVSTSPLFDFDSGLWDYVFVAKSDTEEEVYIHVRDNEDDPADKHQVLGENVLQPVSQYFVVVDANGWGDSWLGSMTKIQFTTKGIAMPWLQLLLDD
jgi:hypothetical protein